jgi:hypothetical protein
VTTVVDIKPRFIEITWDVSNIPYNCRVKSRRRNYFHKLRDQYRELFIERGHWFCQNCDKGSTHLSMHHIIPLEWGGSNDIENIVPMCYTCHKAIHKRIGILFYNGDSFNNNVGDASECFDYPSTSDAPYTEW